jgi:Xaa-Pro aminopeptidase
MLDALARGPLWAESLEYFHGTGHGVGYFLNVHEGPQTIGKAVVAPHMAMRAGMITSNEPGIYRPGIDGWRTINTMIVGERGVELPSRFLSDHPWERRVIEL